MKKWMVGTLLLFLLIACAPTETTTDDVVEDVLEDKVTEETKIETVEKTEKKEEPVEEIKEPAEKVEKPVDKPQETVIVEQKEEMDPQLRNLLKRADERLKSMTFLYGGPETGNLFLDIYHVMGDKIKIDRYDEDYYVQDGYYDTIYVHESIGCCEEANRCRSHNVDNTGIPFDVDLDTLIIPTTPYQWSKEVPVDATIIGPQTFDERSVTYVTFEKENNEYEMWIDDTYGVPHRIVITNAEDAQIKYQFNDLTFNDLDDNDFAIPCKE